MENVLFYTVPFLKNLAILCLTPWLVLLFRAVRSVGVQGFVFKAWLEESKQRFIVGLATVFSLSVLMALTDVAPLFRVVGLDINASPVALGVAIGAMLMLGTNSKHAASKKVAKVKEIQVKAQEIIQKSADIVKDEEKPK
jgi:hypothetical protein